MRRSLGYLFIGILTLVGCTESEVYRAHDPYADILVSTSYRAAKSDSNLAGNMIATAIQQSNEIDVVFYPSSLIEDGHAVLKLNSSERERQALLDLLPIGAKDLFRIGTMSGKSIKKLILERSHESYENEFQVAGIRYHLQFVGGQVRFFNVVDQHGRALDEERYYRVAISDYYYFSGSTFPGYKYRNSITRKFKEERRRASARASLETWLKSIHQIPYLNESRATVETQTIGDVGAHPIYFIQGAQHRSPHYGYAATTSGIVTAVASAQWYPGGTDVYIQDPAGDGVATTSDGIHIHLRDEQTQLQIGDEIVVSGVIYEDKMGSSLSQTSLREINSLEIINRGQPLPPPIVLGDQGRRVPDIHHSTYIGDLNMKPTLNLSDGVDFWESLEGMRVALNNVRVVGFRGGQEELESTRPKGYLTLYVLPDGHRVNSNDTHMSGIIVDEKEGDYNPEIVTLATNHLTRGINTKQVYNVGDVIPGQLVGLMSFQKNLFGGGEFSLVLPEEQESLANFKGSQEIVPIEQRAQSTLYPEERTLTVASFNVENLSGYQSSRIESVAEVIETTLKCADIVTLVEIQDNNGQALTGDSSANVTLENLIEQIECADAAYAPINIDPVVHNEGGQPGGNIRVAMIYNQKRVRFVARPIEDPMAETHITSEGLLSHNPGRVFPNDPAFIKTRKSLVAQFQFLDQDVFVIGNHFNSKLGDDSLWGPLQPAKKGSEKKRSNMADRVNQFVRLIEANAPNAGIVVAGDFNSLMYERPMQILEGRQLTNLMDLLPENKRYTTNYNGNSQALDYIFVNDELMKRNPRFEVLHINSDYMGRVSDHDPIISSFSF